MVEYLNFQDPRQQWNPKNGLRWLTVSNSLGQGSVLQKSLWVSVPSQVVPPYWGTGLEQSRVRCLAPPPQDTVQELQLAQSVQLPSTGKDKWKCWVTAFRGAQASVVEIMTFTYLFLLVVWIWWANTRSTQGSLLVLLRGHSLLGSGDPMQCWDRNRVGCMQGKCLPAALSLQPFDTDWLFIARALGLPQGISLTWAVSFIAALCLGPCTLAIWPPKWWGRAIA